MPLLHLLVAFDQRPLGIAITLISSISLVRSRLFLLLSLFLMGLAGCPVFNPLDQHHSIVNELFIRTTLECYSRAFQSSPPDFLHFDSFHVSSPFPISGALQSCFYAWRSLWGRVSLFVDACLPIVRTRASFSL